MSTETTNKKIKIDNGTTFGKTYTDKAIDAKLPTDIIASANKLQLGVGSTALGNGVNLDGFTYDEATKTLKASGGGGGGSGVAEIVLSDSQMQTLSSTYSITFTDEQANILENTVAFKWTYNGVEIARGTCNKLFFGGSVSYGLNLFVNGIYHYFYTGDDNFNSLTKELTLGSVNIGEAITEENIIISSSNDTIQFGTKPVRFSTINGEGLIQDSTGVGKDYSFTEDKTISLFGKHSILVPKDSADTSILPCTTADNGKVLSVVNGEAQWASAGGGGGELSGDALMGITKDSTTITRTLDTDGKVKFDANTKQDKLYTKTNSGITLTEEAGKSYISSELVYTTQSIELHPIFHAGAHTAGEMLEAQSFTIDGLYISSYYTGTDTTKVVVVDDVAIMRLEIPEFDNNGYRITFEWYALNSGTITKEKQKFGYTKFIIAQNAKRKA